MERPETGTSSLTTSFMADATTPEAIKTSSAASHANGLKRKRRQFLGQFPGDDRIRMPMILEFRFFKIFFWGIYHCQVSQYDCRSLTSTMGHKFRQTAEELQVLIECVGRQSTITRRQRYQLKKRIEPLKRQAKEICILALGGEIRCKPCQQGLELFLEYGRETASFIEFVLHNLQLLLNSKHRPIDPTEHQQIDEKLQVFRKFANRVSHSINRVKNLGELISQTQTWANHLSCLSFLYLIDRLDESPASMAGTMLIDFMQETMSITPGVIASYFQDAHFPQILASYIDFLLEELVTPPVKDEIETLREGLIFLLSFMLDPPEEDSEDKKRILGQIYSIINELSSLSCSIHSNEMKDRISQTKLIDFLQNIAGVEAEVRKLYAITPCSAQFNSPRTNAIGFLYSLLQKLKKWLEEEVNFIARLKHGIQIVWEELESLRPFMQHITDIQNEQKELKDLWTRIVDVVYYASAVTKLCTPKSLPIWYGIICLPSVIEEIKVIKNEVRDVIDSQMCKSKMLSVELEFRNTMLPRTTTSKVEGAFIGFKEETESIINDLIRGGKDLTIISISGMPGQGKTTLAKRIYNDPNIQCHFHKTMWSYVSKECNSEDLMIHLVRDVSETDVKDISNAKIEDLVERLRKCLKGRRYLVVMDDIWNCEVWCQVRLSFPNDQNGSQILFTSRNHDLISQDEWKFISYPLRSFYDEESWDLMKENVSHHDGLGPEFLEIGRQIAICCKGLPLAVALVASLLGKTEQKLELWKQVAKNLKSHLSSEGCMHIIELSYKYLPDYLKACFLYFGAFPRGENICAKRLKLLWIAEGFIKGNVMQYSEDLAEECLDIKGNEMPYSEDLAEKCLDYLVSQSLVVVAEKNSMGGIKRCNVHDLIYDLCLGKIAKDNFLHWLDPKTIWMAFSLDDCRYRPQKYGHHRLCIGKSDPFMEARPTCRRKELPTSHVECLLWPHRLGLGSFDFLKNFKVLTVLNLEDVEWGDDVFPEVILCNIHLKYLALPGRIKNIPPLIAKLWNLETLILRDAEFYRDSDINRRIPDTLWRIKSLRHVIIDGGCVSLEDFEGNESYVAALDNSNIETLGGWRLKIDDQCTVEFLGKMTRLRKLECSFKRVALFSVFGSLENLEVVKFSCGHFNDFIFETCSFPQNENLKKLSLEYFSVASWSVLSTIGKHLPNLEVLKLFYSECVGIRWDLEDGKFSKLRYFKLGGLVHLEEIHVSVDCDNPFPCLEVLVVERCWKLKEIPSEIGEIGSLNTIKMSWCSREASESVMQILEKQRDLGNHSLQVLVTDVLKEKSN